MKSWALTLAAIVSLSFTGRALAGDRCDEDYLTGVRDPPRPSTPAVARSPWKDAVTLTGVEAGSPRKLAADPRRPLIVRDAKWAGQDFSGLRLSGICFIDSDLSGSTWSGAVTSDLAFLQVDLSGANLSHGRFHRGLFLNDKLDHVRAAGSDLIASAIAGGSFDGLDLHGADLTDVQLTCGLIVGEYECEWPKDRVDVREARMTRTRLDLFSTGHVVGPGWNFDGARLDGAVVQYNQIPQFKRAIVVSPVILEASGYSHDRVTLSVADWKALVAAWDAGPENRAAIDCKRAGPVERLICTAKTSYADAWLLRRDAQLAEAYREALEAHRVAPVEQRRWLASRKACLSAKEPVVCLANLYDAREEALRRRLIPPQWLKAGVEAVYVNSSPPAPEAFKATQTYRRMLPVIRATSSSTLQLKAIDATHLKAFAHAEGSNGHECSMEGEAFVLNPATGWFGAPHRTDETDTRTWEDVFRLSGDHVELAPDAIRIEPKQPAGEPTFLISDYIGCGARASFERMTLLPLKLTRGSWPKATTDPPAP